MRPQLVGEWHLNGYAFVETEIEFEGDVPDPEAAEEWLFTGTDVGPLDLMPRSGLELVLHEDGSYSERVTVGGLRLPWYDSQGVQVESPDAGDGTLRESSGHDGAFLHPRDAPPWMTRTRERDRDRLRYDDGDTLICDNVRAIDDSLVRVIAVVTDGLYLNRIVARYGRARA